MDSVQPLRISKSGTGNGNTPASTPNKMPAGRALQEIGNTSQRRNSPSYNQATRKMIVSRESSPYTENSFTKDSPRGFWTAKDPMSPSARFGSDENTPERDHSPGVTSPKRRASIERLQKAGRVKSSNIFALESKDAYDPSNMPIVERPSANRPLSGNLVNNSFTRYDSMRKENNPVTSPRRQGHKRTESETAVPLLSSPLTTKPVPIPAKEPTPTSSPTKSSLSRTSQFGGSFEHESGPWSDGDDRCPTPRARAIHRHNKSVTFHEDPPVINEYENPTPEPSVSAASGSREGSWDSDYSDPDYSFERGSSLNEHRDDSFDADLENADKTPVVLPEDWSRMSPDDARTDLVDEGDDVFEGSSPVAERNMLRSASVTSDGESRPLPPLPGFMAGRRGSATALAAERASSGQRNLPSPPKRASCSKEDILNMTRDSSMTMEERLHLMGHQHGKTEERPSSKHSEAELTITNLDTGEKMDMSAHEIQVEENSVIADLAEYDNSPPKISRESILRKVRNSKYDFQDDEEESNLDDSPARPSYAELAKMDPDEPIPSRENSRETSEAYLGEYVHGRADSEQVEIKEEPTDDDGIDLNAIPTIDEPARDGTRSPSRMDDYERQSSVIRHDVSSASDHDDSESRYSSVEPDAESTVLQAEHKEPSAELDAGKETLEDAMQLLSVKDYSRPEPTATAEPPKQNSTSGDFMGLPSYLASDDYDFGMGEYITPSPPAAVDDKAKQLDMVANPPKLEPAVEVKPSFNDLPRPTYDGAEFSPPGTPDSVIRRDSEVSALSEDLPPPAEAEPEQPVIPERRATIKTNGQLKTRPSATPADLRAMANQRRLVSAERPVPPITQAYQAEMAETVEEDLSQHSSEGDDSKADSGVEHSPETAARRQEAKRQMKLDLEIPALNAAAGDDGLGLESEFERVIEGQKVGSLFPTSSYAARHHDAGANVSPPKQKGYLMRQNTKLVVATNRNFSGDSNGTAKSNDTPMSPTAEARPTSRGGRPGSSPRKPSAEQFLKTEPWNGKARRKSQRQASAAQHNLGPAPPLPGQPSALGVVNEDFAAGTSSLEDDVGEGVERGRLFVKVVGVKELDLPIPRNDRLYFQLTLDNGLHCVTTSPLELGKNAPIGQEFELVVLNDLEFQLTLNTKLPEPPKRHAPTTPTSPNKAAQHKKTSSLSRFLASPKKRAERERQEREVAEAEERRLQEEERRKRASVQPTAWDYLHELVNDVDGSFARSYVNLKAHEKECFGRQLTVDVPCYNEWAQERDAAVVNSVRSKRGNAGPVRRPPYVVGYLELQLLYVPKPAGATDDQMPKSMSSAMREMNRASDHVEVVHESYLSQQGGDCTHWRRRFFRLQGPRLTAYHEHTQQKRAVINLSKATRLVDDKNTLVADPKSANPGSKGGRRKSAFAEEDEGYQYVEEGFRIRFANGETIDFYADSRAEKDEWMNVLSKVLGKADPGKKAASWTDLVLARERVEGVPPQVQAASSAAAGVEVRDFTKPPRPERKLSDRKPVTGSRSVPTSPVKQGGSFPPMPPLAEAESGSRPKTPPMNPRRGHRSRDAVKSMIF
ncbi:Bud site selection protein BUD4 [Pseudocercospora fuligena]|uniref:Bud site selection protein BUD4 n=1 Tax=Pseudocercospora fuligena TaxID=685502 RepID=A0A8H6VKZ3_9PEZI|nr:Bud site selection protein BUD4 [Pseudocercospora fuligena]